MTLKFSDVPPNSAFGLLGQPGVGIGIPPTTDTRLITVSNTGSGNVNLIGLDNAGVGHTLAQVGPNQTVAHSTPTVWFTTALSVYNYGATAGQGVVTIN
jgi:hypothetical protein